jgi:hypothetical protein
MHAFVTRVFGDEDDEPVRLELLLHSPDDRCMTDVRRIEHAAEQDGHPIRSRTHWRDLGSINTSATSVPGKPVARQASAVARVS